MKINLKNILFCFLLSATIGNDSVSVYASASSDPADSLSFSDWLPSKRVGFDSAYSTASFLSSRGLAHAPGALSLVPKAILGEGIISWMVNGLGQLAVLPATFIVPYYARIVASQGLGRGSDFDKWLGILGASSALGGAYATLLQYLKN